ncbi:normocyte-binding protein 1, partial [Francisella tularensis subsp. holarctica]|nr:normocyte-binding protein 1 [Francisella tularensis subsp. holarctica]
NILSSSGYDAVLEKINEFFNKYKSNDSVFSLIREQFEIEDIEKIDTNKLRQLSITPYDILYLVDNQDVKEFAKYFSLSTRGN